jgi:dynein heavy chain 2
VQTDTTDPQLEAALLAAAADMGLKLTQQQVERMLQLHLACEQRIGVIILGPSGSGKSTLWQVSGATA